MKWIDEKKHKINFWYLRITLDSLYIIVKHLKKFLPKSLKRRIREFVKKIYEEMAIYFYMNDKQDLGYFENFLLNNEQLNRIMRNYKEEYNRIKYWVWKETISTGGQNLQNIYKHAHEEEAEIVTKNIKEKKSIVVRILKDRDKVIDYLRGRIPYSDLKDKMNYIIENCMDDAK